MIKQAGDKLPVVTWCAFFEEFMEFERSWWESYTVLSISIIVLLFCIEMFSTFERRACYRLNEFKSVLFKPKKATIFHTLPDHLLYDGDGFRSRRSRKTNIFAYGWFKVGEPSPPHQFMHVTPLWPRMKKRSRSRKHCFRYRNCFLKD